MRFIKHSSILLGIEEGRKGRDGNADVANKACLGSDLAKEWGDVSTICGRRYRSINVREYKAVVGIEKWACFAMRLLVKLEECRAETVFAGSEQGRRRRAVVCYEDDGFWANEEFRIDLEPDLLGESQKNHYYGIGVV
jgi:hypothetical protein